MSDKCGIYSITNKIDNTKYYGSTTSWWRRKSAHKNALKKNKHPNIHLQRAWNKYGEENFEFNFELEVCQPYLLFVEQIYLDSNSNDYNFAKVAGASMRGKKHSPETRAKISAARKGNKFSDETRKKMSIAQKTFSDTDEGKMAKVKAGKANKNRPSKLKGRTITNEHRLHIKEAMQNISIKKRG